MTATVDAKAILRNAVVLLGIATPLAAAGVAASPWFWPLDWTEGWSIRDFHGSLVFWYLALAPAVALRGALHRFVVMALGRRGWGPIQHVVMVLTRHYVKGNTAYWSYRGTAPLSSSETKIPPTRLAIAAADSRAHPNLEVIA